jgi:predicted HicB family RNase H-like nuclease|tara:strand:- start:1431 stop:1625 length:195 start_codon:yes stop_codon:yes gene_type:complete
MKAKTDGRVKKYCAITIPETQHRKLKALAKKRGLRMNAYVPKLLTVAIKDEMWSAACNPQNNGS